jgi:hypothetical protein
MMVNRGIRVDVLHYESEGGECVRGTLIMW